MPKMSRYILDENNEPQEVDDLLEWALSLEDSERRQVAFDTLENGTKVSTVFLGWDASHGLREGAPLLFETAAFGHDSFHVMDRHTTWAEAQEGHARAVKLLA